jgi:hypothetical protein
VEDVVFRLFADDIIISIIQEIVKGVRESESRTGTRLVSPSRRPQNFFLDLSVERSWNVILKAIKPMMTLKCCT